MSYREWTEQDWQTAYHKRSQGLKRFIELKAPPAIVYWQARLLLHTQYRSYWRQILYWSWERVHYSLLWWWDTVKIRWYMHVHLMDREQALDAVFGSEDEEEA